MGREEGGGGGEGVAGVAGDAVSAAGVRVVVRGAVGRGRGEGDA